ncbi:CIC11C00000005739 [Sungouiella intermedia]|uniref:CIC11C00000005739 n=1 Tax=Sungouiella intermedia TaxID=45354 RepID=A0A1L0BU02_9ASCO|nr:CIC11C00000005739 [[Candida] intermedia]
MDRTSACDSNDFTLAFDTMSSGSIAATSSGYNGVNTDETDPDLTFLSNLFPVGYSNVNFLTRETNPLQQLFWKSDANLIRFPRLSGQSTQVQGNSDFDNTIKGIKTSGGPYVGQYPVQLTRPELFVPMNNYTYGHSAADLSVLSRKRQYLTNFTAPNYNPVVKDFKDTTRVVQANHSDFNNENLLDKSPLNPSSGGNDQVEMLRMELNFKSLINKTLSEKLNALTTNDGATPTSSTSPGDSRITMPNNYYQLFKDLTRTLNERTQELEDTKSRMEAILVGLVMNKDSSVSTHGTFDPQELAHRITTKLSILQKENETLLKMVSHGNKQSLLVELGLLKNENKLLRKKLGAQEKAA